MARNATFNRTKFLASKPVEMQFGGQTIYAHPKEFSTGSCGYSASAKVTVLVDGDPVEMQVQVRGPT